MSGTGVCKEWMNLKNYDIGQKRADSCPIKCDIEDIKAEIEEKISCNYGSLVECGMKMALDIIDKHIGAEMESEDKE